jgi:hypothetical protein
MGERLPVPPELEHLIEKREREEDRRQAERRQCDLGPLGAIESEADLNAVPTSERRSGQDRRQKDRRKKPRRNGE